MTAILESGKNLSREEKKTERCPLLYEWHKKQYVGAAHGLAGIYYMLMQVRGGLKHSNSINLFIQLLISSLLRMRNAYTLSHAPAFFFFNHQEWSVCVLCDLTLAFHFNAGIDWVIAGK